MNSPEEHDKLLKTITSSMGDGLFAIDNDGIVLYCNEMAGRLLGYSTDEFLGKNLHELIHHHDKNGNYVPKEKCSTLLALKNKHIHHNDNDIFFEKSGKPIEVSYTATPMIEDGVVVGSILIFRDVTERNRERQLLLLSDNVLQNIEEAVVVTDWQNKIIFTNPHFEILTGYSKDEVMGKNPSIFQSDRHDDEFYVEMWKSIDSSGKWKGEIYNRKKNGEVFVEWLGISTIKDEHGKIIYHIGIFSDITVRKHMEERLREDKEVFEHEASVDALTGIYNRRRFECFFDSYAEKYHHMDTKFSLILFDVDNFKNINDTYGHLVGDSVLVELARLVSGNIRSSDVFARWGGEEFVVLAVHTDAEKAVALADNIRQKIEQYEFSYVKNITASFGVAGFTDADSTHSLMAKVDEALYRAKNSGKNRVVSANDMGI